MTDHLIQHTCATQNVMLCSTVDGQEIVMQIGDVRQTTSLRQAEVWCAAFAMLAMATPEQIGRMLEELPPEMESVRPVIRSALVSPGTTALIALLVRYAIEDARMLRQGPVGPPPGLGGLLP